MYNTENGVKPRFDGGGTEFGMMHRWLPGSHCMFDLDRMQASISSDLILRNENEGFIEYRITDKEVRFAALFELKMKRTKYSEQALSSDDASAIARAELARRIGCRLFVVFATNGKQPFNFYEIETTTRESTHVGTLDYRNEADGKRAAQEFWLNVLGIDRNTW